jgi:TPR repeat protein
MTFEENGIMLPLTNIGWLYRNGWGAARDYAEAMRWFRKAADQGYAPAQRQLAHLAHLHKSCIYPRLATHY